MSAIAELPDPKTQIKVVLPGITPPPAVDQAPGNPAAKDPSPAANPTPIPSPAPQPNHLASDPIEPIPGEPQPVIKPAIDTDVLGDGKKKTPAEFAAERRAAKEKELEDRLGVPDLRREADEAKATALALEIQVRELQAERDRINLEREQNEALAKQRKEELDKASGKYFDDFKAAVDPYSDPDYVASATRFSQTMASALPERIPVGDDEKRIFPEQLLSNPMIAQGIDNVMSHYAAARRSGDAEAIDLAVNAVAQLLGVPMTIDPDPAKCVGLLRSSEPVFRQIEEAMKSAIPHWGTKNQRRQMLAEEAPRIVQEGLLARERTIAGNIKSAIFIPPDEAQARLRANPTDSAAVLATLIDATPELAELVERTIAGFAPAFARMGKIDMPTLVEKNPEAIQRHQQESLLYRNRLANAMPAAVLGTIAGPVIADLIGQLTALNLRLGKEAVNTNPGPIDSSSGTPPKPAIPTSI